MTGLEDTFQRFWGLILGLILYCVWLIRLEGKVLRIEQDNARRDSQRVEDMMASKDARKSLQEAQASMQEQLGHLRTQMAVATEGNKHILAAVSRIEEKLQAGK